MKNSPIHIDLFAGPGGIATGFNAAGFNTSAAIEYVDSCCETYSANHPNTRIFNNDIREVQVDKIVKSLNLKSTSSVDVVTGGFPCETFSTAGSKSRVYNDHRNYLYKEAIRIGSGLNTKFLMLENVPAFMSKLIDKGSDTRVLDLLLEDLEKAGFKYHHYQTVNASDFGVPQNRTRFILIASKYHQIKQFNLKKIGRKVTVNEALSDLPLISDNQESRQYFSAPQNEYQKNMRSYKYWGINTDSEVNLSYHITPKHRPGTIKRLSLIKQGEGLKNLFDKFDPAQIAEYQKEKVLPKKWYIQRNYRLKGNDQSKTVTSHALDELVHPTLNRGLSIREVARLQSFPDWYDFKGGPILCPHMYKTQDKYEQIGDAVPPLLARALGKHIITLLK